MTSSRHAQRREVRWERMFPDELEAAFAHRPLVFLTYGLCEPHGPQNALGLDTLKAHAVACRAARTYGGIVAPPSWWHIHEFGDCGPWGHIHIGDVERTWLTALPPWQFYKNVLYHIRAAEALGFHAALLVTGHGAGAPDLTTLAELVQPHVGTRLLGLGDWEGNEPGFDGCAVDHAGKVETSLLWALEPECVDVSRLPPGGDPGPHWAMGSDAPLADRRVGEEMAEAEVAHLVAKASELLSAYERIGPGHTLLTFGDVEELWETLVRPALPRFAAYEELWMGQGVPEDSRWYANWRLPKRASAREPSER